MKSASVIALAMILAACASRPEKAPVIEVVTITCPEERPLDPPVLPERPPAGDLRALEPDRYRIEGIIAGFAIKQYAYIESWEDCPGRGD